MPFDEVNDPLDALLLAQLIHVNRLERLAVGQVHQVFASFHTQLDRHPLMPQYLIEELEVVVRR